MLMYMAGCQKWLMPAAIYKSDMVTSKAFFMGCKIDCNKGIAMLPAIVRQKRELVNDSSGGY